MEENCTPAQIAAASRQSPRGERENGDQDVASKSLAIPHSGHRTTSSKRKKIDLTLEWQVNCAGLLGHLKYFRHWSEITEQRTFLSDFSIHHLLAFIALGSD